MLSFRAMPPAGVIICLTKLLQQIVALVLFGILIVVRISLVIFLVVLLGSDESNLDADVSDAAAPAKSAQFRKNGTA